MPLLRTPSQANFGAAIEGTVGTFATPAGKVLFFQTRARLSRGDTSNAGRLTSLLMPAREALEVKEMDFNQLLQRDLDDHRIAHDLVPYILRPSEGAHGPAFFPPIVTALLPFQDRRPIEELPALTKSIASDDSDYPDVHWEFLTCGDVFRLQRVCDANGTLDSTGGAVLRWNDERAKLVIMDGQHRAMALLAIHRTQTNSWRGASERYKPFYEARVNELLLQADEVARQSLGVLEFPVTICLFPDYAGPGKNPHAAARKLFVDVNKEAKPPSESRLILLSDARLDHVLSRELLNHLRSSGQGNALPLYAVEYDNPEPKTTTPRRWNAVTNLEILLRSVGFCCFGPKEIITDVKAAARPKGKPNKRKMNAYFREQMKLEDVLEASIQDGPRIVERQDIGLDSFPIYNHPARRALLDRFFELWGRGFIRLFSEVEPYRAHIEAARAIAEGWGPAPDVTAALAREALFEGVGMFWALEQGHEHWRERVVDARQSDVTPPPKTDIALAWELVDQHQRGRFDRERARLYLGAARVNDEEVDACREFYNVAITYAAQVGLALTWATLRAANPAAEPDTVLDAVIHGINRSLTSGPVQSRDRRLILRKETRSEESRPFKPFNLLPKMDAPFASYFRFFWLELLLLEENHLELRAAGIHLDGAMGLLADARASYINKVVDDHVQSYRKTHPDAGTEQGQQEGRKTALDALTGAYKWWFGYTAEQARGMLQELVARTAEETDIEEGEAEEDEGGTLESELGDESE